MSNESSAPVSYHDAGASNGGAVLNVATESYFAECLLSNRGHIVLSRSDGIVAIVGTRYMTKSIGYRREGEDVVIVNGDGIEIERFDKVRWVLGTVAPVSRAGVRGQE